MVQAGDTYGLWTTIRPEVVKQRTHWLSRCECGTERLVNPASLVSGTSLSCGCQRIKRRGGTVVSHGLSQTPVYKVWTSMHQRCTNPNSQMWQHYGARGIKVDPRWNDFQTFMADMGPRPEGHSIERRDNDGDYCPENCHWANGYQQARNTSRSAMLTYRGETKTISEWALETGIHKATIGARIRKGMTPEEALTKRLRYSKRR